MRVWNTAGRPRMNSWLAELDGGLLHVHEAILSSRPWRAERRGRGLRLTRAVLVEAERLAARRASESSPLWTADEQEFDVRVEPLEPWARDEGPVHVLLVEDDESLRTILARHLASKGFASRRRRTRRRRRATSPMASGPALVPAGPEPPRQHRVGTPAWPRPRQRRASAGCHHHRDDRHPRQLREFAVAGYLPKPFAMETLVWSLWKASSRGAHERPARGPRPGRRFRRCSGGRLAVRRGAVANAADAESVGVVTPLVGVYLLVASSRRSASHARQRSHYPPPLLGPVVSSPRSSAATWPVVLTARRTTRAASSLPSERGIYRLAGVDPDPAGLALVRRRAARVRPRVDRLAVPPPAAEGGLLSTDRRWGRARELASTPPAASSATRNWAELRGWSRRWRTRNREGFGARGPELRVRLPSAWRPRTALVRGLELPAQSPDVSAAAGMEHRRVRKPVRAAARLAFVVWPVLVLAGCIRQTLLGPGDSA